MMWLWLMIMARTFFSAIMAVLSGRLAVMAWEDRAMLRQAGVNGMYETVLTSQVWNGIALCCTHTILLITALLSFLIGLHRLPSMSVYGSTLMLLLSLIQGVIVVRKHYERFSLMVQAKRLLRQRAVEEAM